MWSSRAVAMPIPDVGGVQNLQPVLTNDWRMFAPSLKLITKSYARLKRFFGKCAKWALFSNPLTYTDYSVKERQHTLRTRIFKHTSFGACGQSCSNQENGLKSPYPFPSFCVWGLGMSLQRVMTLILGHEYHYQTCQTSEHAQGLW